MCVPRPLPAGLAPRLMQTVTLPVLLPLSATSGCCPPSPLPGWPVAYNTPRHSLPRAAPPQRYIGLLPAFQSSLDALPWVREPAVSADDAAVAERLRPLSRLFSTLGETVEMEVGHALGGRRHTGACGSVRLTTSPRHRSFPRAADLEGAGWVVRPW